MTAVLLVSGCGSSDDDSQEKEQPAEPGSPSQGQDPGSLEGSWVTGTGAKALVLSIVEGQAALIGSTTCSGTVTSGDTATLALTCADGSTDRTAGTVTLTGSSLVVKWNGAGSETFKKAETPADIPTDFPTKLPDTLPTDIPELPN